MSSSPAAPDGDILLTKSMSVPGSFLARLSISSSLLPWGTHLIQACLIPRWPGWHRMNTVMIRGCIAQLTTFPFAFLVPILDSRRFGKMRFLENLQYKLDPLAMQPLSNDSGYRM